MAPCQEFLKTEFIGLDLTKLVPRSYVKDSYANLLTCIQRYFTCEGRYHKVYSYHFKLLLHFTGKISLDLPFYLFRSLGKMSDKVQLKKEACETSLFHHGLIKLIIIHGLAQQRLPLDNLVNPTLTPPIENPLTEQQGPRVTGPKRTQKRKNPSLALGPVKRRSSVRINS